MGSETGQSPAPMLKRSIYLVGPHCTGKTTVANAIHPMFSSIDRKIPLLQETARKVLSLKGYNRGDIKSSRCLDMQRDILVAQYNAEKEASLISQNFITDRSGIDPIIYAMKYSNSPEDWINLLSTKEWVYLREMYRDPQKSLVVLFHPCEDFLNDDGTRMMPIDMQEWKEFAQLFQNFLIQESIPFKNIGDDCIELLERVKKIMEWACC